MKRPKMELNDATLRKISIASGVAMILGFGVALGAIAPIFRSLADQTVDKISDLQRNGLAYLGIKPTGHMAPRRTAVLDAVQIEHGRESPGVTLVTGLFGMSLRSRLYSTSGEVIWEWPLDLFTLFPEHRKYRFDKLAHGDYLYPNGDLLLIIDHVGMAKIDACGKIVWGHHNLTHHSIDVDDDGFIWSPRGKRRFDDRRLSDKPVLIDRIGKYDPATGDLVETIDIGEVLLDAGLEGIIKSNVLRSSDVLHINDVEPLKKSMADAFPMFAAGDIMVSSRNTNAIFVLDGKTHGVKWWRVGPMHGQHDPDFQPNGEITVFDNRTAEISKKSKDFLGGADGSRIIALNPATYDYRVLYESNDYNKFYSAYRGKHQLLANGNILMTESEGGRAFEATPDGHIAWMVVSEFDKKNVGWLTSATRYPESYASIGKNCPKAE